MKNLKRTLITVLAMILVCVLSVSATLAYLFKQTETVVNTFVVGNVEITLDELDVDNDDNTADNVTVGNEKRDRANKYKLISGQTLVKDPTVHVSMYSEEAYIFVKVTFTSDVASVLDMTDVASQMATNGWTKLQDDIYYYRETVTGLGQTENEHLPVFETITVKSTATGAELARAAAEGQNISITAYAIQSDTIKNESKTHPENASAAWTALKGELDKLN